MTNEKSKWRSLFPFLIFIGIVFALSHFLGEARKDDIKQNSKYAFAQITKWTGSLKNGNRWHYKFFYEGKEYKNYQPTHIDYNVNVGDYFIVSFSSQNPEHSEILYDYKLKEFSSETIRQVWNTIPKSMTRSGRK